MKGYWNDPQATQAAIRDGWLYTGDIGRIDPDGHLIITDRKKDILVLSGGETLSPQRIEERLVYEAEISQAFIDGRRHVIALIVPDADYAMEWARAQGRCEVGPGQSHQRSRFYQHDCCCCQACSGGLIGCGGD